MICAKCQKESDDDKHYARCNDGYCFSCSFWDEIVQEGGWVIEGHVYQGKPGIKQGPSWSLGFSGRKFYIKPHEGEPFVTNSLWHRGEVPSNWRFELPDNAEFINGEGWEECGGTLAMRSGMIPPSEFAEAATQAQLEKHGASE